MPRLRVTVELSPKQNKTWRFAAKKAGKTLCEFIRDTMDWNVDPRKAK